MQFGFAAYRKYSAPIKNVQHFIGFQSLYGTIFMLLGTIFMTQAFSGKNANDTKSEILKIFSLLLAQFGIDQLCIYGEIAPKWFRKHKFISFVTAVVNSAILLAIFQWKLQDVKRSDANRLDLIESKEGIKKRDEEKIYLESLNKFPEIKSNSLVEK